jgi:hypothetical protein
MQVLSSKELILFTRHFLFLESTKTDIKKIRFFSDGDTSFIFSLKENFISENKDSNVLDKLTGSIWYGQIKKFNDN